MRKKQGSERSTSKLVAVRIPNDLHEALMRASTGGEVTTSQIIVSALSEKLNGNRVKRQRV